MLLYGWISEGIEVYNEQIRHFNCWESKKLFLLPVIMTLRCGKAHLKINTFIVFVFATEIA